VGDYFQTIDIYHDPKTLRLENAEAWGSAVTYRMLRPRERITPAERNKSASADVCQKLA
jgi:hypothetical protein